MSVFVEQHLAMPGSAKYDDRYIFCCAIRPDFTLENTKLNRKRKKYSCISMSSKLTFRMVTPKWMKITKTYTSLQGNFQFVFTFKPLWKLWT